MCLGSMLYAYGISMVFNLMEKKRVTDVEFKKLNLDTDLTEKIQEYFQNMDKVSTHESNLTKLDNILRARVNFHIFFSSHRLLRIFHEDLDGWSNKQIQRNFKAKVVSKLVYRIFQPRSDYEKTESILVKEGQAILKDSAQSELCGSLSYIFAGRAKTFKWVTNKHTGLRLRTFREDKLIGNRGFLNFWYDKQGHDRSSDISDNDIGIKFNSIAQTVGAIEYILENFRLRNNEKVISETYFQPYTIEAQTYTQLWSISFKVLNDLVAVIYNNIIVITFVSKDFYDFVAEATEIKNEIVGSAQIPEGEKLNIKINAYVNHRWNQANFKADDEEYSLIADYPTDLKVLNNIINIIGSIISSYLLILFI